MRSLILLSLLAVAGCMKVPTPQPPEPDVPTPIDVDSKTVAELAGELRRVVRSTQHPVLAEYATTYAAASKLMLNDRFTPMQVVGAMEQMPDLYTTDKLPSIEAVVVDHLGTLQPTAENRTAIASRLQELSQAMWIVSQED